jgi:DNA-binding NarL/FixJ family response regulator
MQKITVLLCDDHAVVREGLRSLLDASGDIAVIGEAENGIRVVSEAIRLQPDVVLMDIAMPLLNGITAARKLAVEVPAAKVLILTSYNDDRNLQQAVAAGAVGYLTKEAASEDLLEAIRELSKGNPFFSPPIAARLLKQWRNRGVEVKSGSGPLLTIRQTEVVQLIAEGYATKQIADVLSLGKKCVEKHRQDLMNKLGIHKVALLTRFAVSNGVVETNRLADWQSSPELQRQTCKPGFNVPSGI